MPLLAGKRRLVAGAGRVGGARPLRELHLPRAVADRPQECEFPDALPHAAEDDDSFVTVNGELVLELSGRNGDESGPAHLVAWTKRGRRYVASEDLRHR